ncbi:MAG: hypothetical protein K0V04_37195 [Deltaproteobacteria bacterium]|nr:hypothetical protein [Deltaproteobacteria bacterium]
MWDQVEVHAWHEATGAPSLWESCELGDQLRDVLERPGGEARLRSEVEPHLGTGFDAGLPALLDATTDLLRRGRVTLELSGHEPLGVDPHHPIDVEDLGSLVDLAEGPPDLPSEAPEHWIEIRLVDEAEQPITNERYRIDLPDGKSQEGQTDGAGIVRIDPIYKAGHCRVQFPDLVEELALAS